MVCGDRCEGGWGGLDKGGKGYGTERVKVGVGVDAKGVAGHRVGLGR